MSADFKLARLRSLGLECEDQQLLREYSLGKLIEFLLPHQPSEEMVAAKLDQLRKSGAVSTENEDIAREILTQNGANLVEASEILTTICLPNSPPVNKQLSSRSSSSVDGSYVGVVIDPGSMFTKIGYADEAIPHTAFPTVVGKLKNRISYLPEYFVGDKAWTMHKCRAVNLSFPIQRGLYTNWDSMEKVLEHSLTNALKVDPKLHPVLCSEDPFNTKANRERMAQIMFESFEVPGFYLANCAALALLTEQSKTGLVLSSGDGVTHAIPIHEGRIVSKGVKTVDYGGKDLSEYLRTTLLAEVTRNLWEGEAALREARNIKETLCYVAPEFPPAEIERNTLYQVSDCTRLDLGDIVVRCPEALFDAKVLAHQGFEIHKLVFNAIITCDPTIWKDLFGNIVLSGGNTLFPGIEVRLKRELEKLAGQNPNTTNMKIHIVTPPNRLHSVWTGGAHLASQHNFREMYMTIEEYNELGPSMIHQKCL